jgi:signal recognition particle subunit SRP72
MLNIDILPFPFAVLKLSPSDGDAVAVKVALLIDVGNAAEALQLIDASPTLASGLAFERAYCTYRLGRLQEALTTLSSVGDDRAAARLQLEAQVHYRLGNYKECIELYDRLFKEHDTIEASAEVQTNILAAYAVGGRASEIPKTMTEMKMSPKDGFEAGFNAACGLIDEEKLTQAEEALYLAKRVGEEQLYEEELEEEDVESELGPITAQLAYVAARQGKLSEAAEVLREGVDSKDETVGAVSALNLAAVLLHQRPGDRKAALEGLKALEPFVERSGGYLRVKSGLEGRLGATHCEAVISSYASAAVGAGKQDIAREALRSLEKLYKGSTSGALLQAALLSRDGKVKEASAVLDEVASALAGSPTALAAQLTRVQLAAVAGDGAGAAALLASLPDAEIHRPAVVATRVALLELAGDFDGAVALIKSVLDNHPGSGNSAIASRWALRRLAALDIQQGNLEAAAADLQQLAATDDAALEDPELLSILPRLIACCAPEKAGDLANKIPTVASQVSAAEVDALEASGGAGAGGHTSIKAADPSAVAAAAGKRKAADGGSGEKRKKKRKRKIRYPKGFDPGNPSGHPLPDPERWMPKWQRAEAKKARKKRKDKDVGKGSQGAGKVDSSLDKSGPSAEAAAAPAAAASKKSGGGSSKKKGKGRR